MTTKTSAVVADMQAAIQRLSMRDVLLVPETAQLFVSQIAKFTQTDAATAAQLEVTSREAIELAYGYTGEDRDDRKSFVYQDGMAIIPIHGTLLNRFNSSWGFVTGYNFIRRQMNAALDDDDVEQIIFDVDSPGGEASGCFELAREIMASRRVKPSLAMVDSLAASGGMALAGSATKMYGIPSARIGSIGVYRLHVSYEGALKQAGIKFTFATAGEHKVDGNPYEDISKEVLDDWRESAGKTWDDFISLVAEARGIPEAAVRDTQARIYRADEALALGLINAVKTTTEAVSAFVAEMADDDTSSDEEDEEMTDKTKGSEVTSGLTSADLQTIGSMIGTAVSTALAPLANANRANSIKDYAASKGKGFKALGASLAADENITIEQATKIIDAAAPAVAAPAPKKGKQNVSDESDDNGPEDEDDDADEGDDDEDEGEADEEAARSSRRGNKAKGGRSKQNVSNDDTNHFDNAMGNSRNPKVGSGNERRQKNGEQSPDDQANTILGDAAMCGSTWAKPKQKAA